MFSSLFNCAGCSPHVTCLSLLVAPQAKRPYVELEQMNSTRETVVRQETARTAHLQVRWQVGIDGCNDELANL